MPHVVAAAIWVMIVLLVLTPVFTNMPQNAQGAIIIVAVSGLLNYTEFFYLWKARAPLLLLDIASAFHTMPTCCACLLASSFAWHGLSSSRFAVASAFCLSDSTLAGSHSASECDVSTIELRYCR